MDQSDWPKFEALMTEIKLATGKELSDKRINFLWNRVKNLPFSKVSERLEHHINTKNTLPTLAQLRGEEHKELIEENKLKRCEFQTDGYQCRHLRTAEPQDSPHFCTFHRWAWRMNLTHPTRQDFEHWYDAESIPEYCCDWSHYDRDRLWQLCIGSFPPGAPEWHICGAHCLWLFEKSYDEIVAVRPELIEKQARFMEDQDKFMNDPHNPLRQTLSRMREVMKHLE